MCLYVVHKLMLLRYRHVAFDIGVCSRLFTPTSRIGLTGAVAETREGGSLYNNAIIVAVRVR
jgi:hypothetical protein